MDTIKKLEKIAKRDVLMENFIINFVDQVQSDGEAYDKKFRQLKAIYEIHPFLVDEIMTIICGYCMDTLADQAINTK